MADILRRDLDEMKFYGNKDFENTSQCLDFNKNKAPRSKIVLVHNEENVNRFLAWRSPHAPEYNRQIQYDSTQNVA